MRLVVLVAATVFSLSIHAEGVTFEQAFSASGEPRATHFEAEYVARGSTHRIEVWRDAERRIRRRTDDAAEIYALRKAAKPDFHLAVLDLKRKLRTDIDRDKLYRIGNFTDWFDLGHGLRHPMGKYTLVAAKAPAGGPTPAEPCQWYNLAQSGRVTYVCWSVASRVPILIQDQVGATVWRVTKVDHKAILETVFQIADTGFVRTDANEDIDRD
jgi:hypothetical protein